jgi:type I restriction enzyme S subunit
MSRPRYPAYKDSGVEWIGSVPVNWEVGPLKRLLDLQNGADHKAIETDDGVPVIGSGGAFAFASMAMFDGESVLLGRKGTIDRPIYVNGPFWTVDTMYWSKVNPDVSAKFAYYAATTIPFGYYSTNTALPSMTKAALNAHAVACPAYEEQSAIAAFLDRETAKIDALIAEQERLLGLLSEKRQAVISHAVTKGLNSDAPMKDSGVEWLGEVPAHWDVWQFRHCLAKPLANGIFKKKDEFGSGTLLVNVFDMYREDLRVNYLWLDRVVCSEEERLSYSVSAGDLLFVRSSLKREGIAAVALAESCEEPAVFECHLIRATPNPLVLHSRYASYVFGSARFRAQFIKLAKVTTMTTIDQESIKSIPVVIPPVAEQAEIAFWLDSKVASIDRLQEQVISGISLLLERRSALISAVVTGQIDVRQAA